jgi:hypothetical protein
MGSGEQWEHITSVRKGILWIVEYQMGWQPSWVL